MNIKTSYVLRKLNYAPLSSHSHVQQIEINTDGYLLDQIENHLSQFRLIYTNFPNIDKIEHKNFTLIRSKYPEKMFNGVLRTNFLNTDKSSIDDKISEILNYFFKYNPIFLYINSSSDSSKLKNYLQKYNFYHNHRLTCMYINLKKMSFRTPIWGGLKIEIVNSSKLLDDFFIPLNQAFPLSAKGAEIRYQAYANFLRESSPKLKNFIAIIDGKPVGSVSLFGCIGDGDIGAYNLSVLPGFNRHGVGTKLMEFALCEAKKLNCDRCFAHATQQGFPVLSRMGFQSMGTIECFVRDQQQLPSRL